MLFHLFPSLLVLCRVLCVNILKVEKFAPTEAPPQTVA